MKKILITFSLLSMFLSVENVFATSGACSYHSGVNCSASNSSYNGYVVCNDGWVNSSVYASDAEECKTYDPCPKIIYGLSCNTEEDYSKVYSQVQATRGTSAAIEARRGLIGSSFAVSGTLQQDKLDSCRMDIDLYSKMISSRISCQKEIDIKNKKQFDTQLSNICIKYGDAGSIFKDNMCVDPLKLKTTDLPNATEGKAYSTDISYSYNGKSTPILVVENPGYDFMFNLYNFNGDNGKFNLRFTPKKVGDFIFNTRVILDNMNVVAQNFKIKVLKNDTSITPQYSENNVDISNLTQKAKLTQKLSLGSKNIQVNTLQKMLGLEQSGYFGQKTKKALQEFQKKNSLLQTGAVGPATMEKLNAL